MTDYIEFSRVLLTGEPIDALSAKFGLKTAIGDLAVMVKMAEAKLLDDKNQDYGPNNIKEIGILGVCSRIRDKVARIENLINKRIAAGGGVLVPVNESLEDAAMDIANYGTIITLVLKDLWG